MQGGFSTLDWGIFFGYFLLLALSSFLLGREKISSTREYFSAKNSMPMLGVALSLLATSQSAATFLGVPDFSYRYDFTFIGFYLSSLLAVVFISYYLIPLFYKHKVITVYELLEVRYSSSAKKQAGILFLVGRVFASGARLYIAALAISMIVFSDTIFMHILFSTLFLLFGALLYTYFGGIKSVIYSDIIQAVLYIGAGVLVVFYLLDALDGVDIVKQLDDAQKLTLFTTQSDAKFSLFTLFSGWLLLNIAAFGLDQDMMQRVLSSKDATQAKRSLWLSVILSIPVVLLFLLIGVLLFVFYQQQEIVQDFNGERVSIFMYYILNELPDGVRALVTIGAIAAALSSTNSVLGAMASVAIEDIYKPYIEKKDFYSETHLLKASKVAVLLFALLLLVMSLFSFYAQHYTQLSLIGFALGVMAFAYTGLLGVFASALFSSRGTPSLVPYALAGGFITVLVQQPYTFGLSSSFTMQMVSGMALSFFIMQLKKES